MIGGHIWDSAFPQFQARQSLSRAGQWPAIPRGRLAVDILIGSGTPNHVNDPVVSGVWRPKNWNAYFEDDPGGNIACWDFTRAACRHFLKS